MNDVLAVLFIIIVMAFLWIVMAFLWIPYFLHLLQKIIEKIER